MAAQALMRRTEQKEEEYRVKSPLYVRRICPLELSTAVCVIVVEGVLFRVVLRR
jgi:hypothetical protein